MEAAGEDRDDVLRAASTLPRSRQCGVEEGICGVGLGQRGEVAGLDAGAQPVRNPYDQLSQAWSEGSGSNGSPPSYQPGPLHISKWRWHPWALPVSPTAPIVWPV